MQNVKLLVMVKPSNGFLSAVNYCFTLWIKFFRYFVIRIFVHNCNRTFQKQIKENENQAIGTIDYPEMFMMFDLWFNISFICVYVNFVCFFFSQGVWKWFHLPVDEIKEINRPWRHMEILDLRSNTTITAQKMKFSIKDFFSKCDQIRR